jgi:hypothetical protein
LDTQTIRSDTAAANAIDQAGNPRLREPVDSVLELFGQNLADMVKPQQLFQISLNGSNDQEVVGIMSAIDSFIYLVITVFIGINIYSSFLHRSQPGVFAMQLFLLGFAIWELILEVQNRYGIITFPYLIWVHWDERSVLLSTTLSDSSLWSLLSENS